MSLVAAVVGLVREVSNLRDLRLVNKRLGFTTILNFKFEPRGLDTADLDLLCENSIDKNNNW